MSPPELDALPAEAAYVVVGAGAIGCAVAAALVESGRSEVLVLDANVDIAQGTTSMGAGMFGLLRNDLERVVRDVEGLEVFRGLSEQGEARPVFERTGSIRTATSGEGVVVLRGLADIARRAGVAAELVGPNEITAWESLDTSKLRMGLYVPEDGQIRPHQVAAAFRSSAVRGGARFVQDVRVQRLRTGSHGAVEAVETDRGRVRTPCVVNAAGASAAGIARTAGLELPIIPVRHSYYVTAPLAAVTRALPHLRFTEQGLYARARDAGVLVGGWDAPGQSLTLDPRHIAPEAPADFPDLPWPSYEGFDALLADLMPPARRWPRQAFARGWPTFTPDAQHVIGPSRQVPGLVMAAGCNAHGIAGAPAIAKLVVQSLDRPDTPYLEWLSPDRFRRGFSWPEAIAQARTHSETYNTPAVQAA